MDGEAETAKASANVSARFSITDLSREFSVTSRTLRFYEDQGLLRPERVGSSRSYSSADRARLAWILRGRAVGFSLADIRELLDLYAPGDARRPQLRATLAKSRERIETLQAQRTAIDATIAELQHLCGEIETSLQPQEESCQQIITPRSPTPVSF